MYFDSLALQERQQIVDFLRRKQIWGKAFVDLVIEEIAALLSDNQELLEITELVFNGPRQECSSACWNRIILQATSKGFVVSGLRAAGPGLGSVCALVGSKLRVGHRERGRGRMTGRRGKFAAKPDGADGGRILVARAVCRKRFVRDGHDDSPPSPRRLKAYSRSAPLVPNSKYCRTMGCSTNAVISDRKAGASWT